MELQDLSLPSNGFVAFIMKHNATLSYVAFANVEVLEGTWEEPLQKVIEMNQLHHLQLINLYQTGLSVKVPDSFNLMFDKMEPEVVLLDRNDINIAADVFRHYFWTTASNLAGDSRHVVDLRLVDAAVNGEIEYGSGLRKA
ncbi:hypothetical protein EK21DRAFT_119599 [Setomelanomma holmii]|uniref:Uncharacterized protein n=1 Tax=Setomelanomma holmii TaxID=210430 RepID=A0A9P4GTD5_9PLEO|nr:hypothetical protein EK21DRAFT_119599 [Setomelanomma holmii]